MNEEDEFNFDTIKDVLERFSVPASKNEAAQAGITVLERGYYELLRDVYLDYNRKEITLEQAKNKKTKLQRDYFEEWKGNLDGIAVAIERQEDIRKSDIARSDILKSENLKEIATIACQTISIMTGDVPFGKLTKEKIERL